MRVMLGYVTFVGKRNTKIVLNLLDSVPECKLRFFYARFEEDEIMSCRRSEVLCQRSWSRDRGRLWSSSNRTALNDIQRRGPSSGGVRVFLFLGLRPLLLVQNWRGVHVTKHRAPRRALIRLPGGHRHQSFIALVIERGPTTLNKEAQECLARQDEENLQAGLALSHEEACYSGHFIASPEASVDHVSLELAPLSILVMDIRANTMSPTLILELETFEAPGREGVEADATKTQGSLPKCDTDLSEVKVPMRHGVMGSTFGEASSCPFGEQLFCRSFDMEARALKILGDLLPVQSRGIKESHALSLLSLWTKRGKGPASRYC
ncbi:hypothetical protein ACLOJK_027447 [Asimina triloba]